MCLCLSKSLPSFVQPVVEFSVVISRMVIFAPSALKTSQLVRFTLSPVSSVTSWSGNSCVEVQVYHVFFLYTPFSLIPAIHARNICTSSFGVFAKSQNCLRTPASAATTLDRDNPGLSPCILPESAAVKCPYTPRRFRCHARVSACENSGLHKRITLPARVSACQGQVFYPPRHLQVTLFELISARMKSNFPT